MSPRDRIVVIGILVVAMLGAGWMLVVSPERQKASKLNAQIGEAQTQLTSAEGLLANARTAQSQYASAYASIVSLGKAVPTSQEVPSLIFELSHATNQRSVEFASITSSAAGSSSSPSASAPVLAAAGFTQMPFTFGFNGSFFALERLFRQLDNFTKRTAAGDIAVNGRLLTIQSVKLAPQSAAGEASSGGAASGLSGTITATAYDLPAEGGLTGSATSTTPGTGAASSAASTGASSSPTAPAVARVTP